MKRTGSAVLALTAALTASSIFRESMCLSRYSCTDISSSFSFFFSETQSKFSQSKNGDSWPRNALCVSSTSEPSQLRSKFLLSPSRFVTGNLLGARLAMQQNASFSTIYFLTYALQAHLKT